MILLAIDPGETTGYVILEVTSGEGVEVPTTVGVEDAWEEKVRDRDVGTWSAAFLHVLRQAHAAACVLEDYRVYQAHAGHHVGARLFTAELIGRIETLGAICVPSIPCHRLQANEKGRWPEARLDAKFPGWKEVDHIGRHALDALKLGLTWLEKKQLWTP